MPSNKKLPALFLLTAGVASATSVQDANAIRYPGTGSIVTADVGYEITWDTVGDYAKYDTGYVTLQLCKGPSTNCVILYNIASGIDITEGSYTWVPSTDLEDSCGSTGYGIKMIVTTDADDADLTDDPFQYSTQFGIANSDNDGNCATTSTVSLAAATSAAAASAAASVVVDAAGAQTTSAASASATGVSDGEDDEDVVTEIVTEYTTYCPAATTVALGGSTYTVSAGNILTINNPDGITVTRSATQSGSGPIQTGSGSVSGGSRPGQTGSGSVSGGSGPAATGVSGGNGVVTEVVTDYTTYCPEATSLVFGDKTYTVTAPTTLTIHDSNGFTITRPANQATATGSGPAATGGVSGGNGVVTEVVTDYTTYCPEATNLVFGDKTYTVTAPTTLTIHDSNGFTVTRPANQGSQTGSGPAATGGVSGGNGVTTEVVTEYTTYCPEATNLVFGDKTYTVTAPTTLTVKDNNGFTITRPVNQGSQTGSGSGPAPTGGVSGGNGFPNGGNGNGVVTEVVTDYTTYCPEATNLVFGDKTYTVTAPTTLTVKDNNGFTITRPATQTGSGSGPAPTGGVSGGNGFPGGNGVVTTEVVTDYTTYCPEATNLVFGDKTYTITAPTTLTVHDTKAFTVTRTVTQSGSGSGAVATPAGSAGIKAGSGSAPAGSASTPVGGNGNGKPQTFSSVVTGSNAKQTGSSSSVGGGAPVPDYLAAKFGGNANGTVSYSKPALAASGSSSGRVGTPAHTTPATSTPTAWKGAASGLKASGMMVGAIVAVAAFFAL